MKYVVEVLCGGNDAAGGGCGAFLRVEGVRESVQTDYISSRESFDTEVRYSGFDPSEADEDHAITKWQPCRSCRRI